MDTILVQNLLTMQRQAPLALTCACEHVQECCAIQMLRLGHPDPVGVPAHLENEKEERTVTETG